MKENNTIGWDIGGAHLKIVVLDKDSTVIYVDQIETPIWKGLEVLERAIESVPESLMESAEHGITMTGELADIFPDRTSGVRELVRLFSQKVSGNINIYAAQKGWLKANDIEGSETHIASANWHAASSFISTKIPQGLLIDTGSTTTDIIPFFDQKTMSVGFSDQQRLQQDELVYTGVNRTSVATVISRVPFAGEWQQITTENFSTMADVYCLTGDIPENAGFTTADGNGTSMIDCARRLARIIGFDLHEAELCAWQQLAHYIARQQLQNISQAVARVCSRFHERFYDQEFPIVGAGAGRFLIRKITQSHNLTYIDFADLVQGDEMLKQAAAICAPATACAAILT
ncbi:MAG: hydantoinase/oxoprolinase family protein [Gammaproteobacteria bacterium]